MPNFTERQQTALTIKEFMVQKGADLQSLEAMHGLMYQAEEAGEVDDGTESRCRRIPARIRGKGPERQDRKGL